MFVFIVFLKILIKKNIKKHRSGSIKDEYLIFLIKIIFNSVNKYTLVFLNIKFNKITLHLNHLYRLGLLLPAAPVLIP